MLSSCLKDIVKKNGLIRTLSMLVLFGLSSVAEGLGMLLLLPVVVKLGISVGEGGSVVLDYYDMVIVGLGFSPTLLTTVSVAVSAFLLQYLAMISAWILGANLQQRYKFAWRKKLFESISTVKWNYMVDRKVGATMNILTTEIDRLGQVFGCIQQIWVCSLGGVVILGAASWMSYQMTIVLCLSGGLIAFLIKPFQRRAFRLGHEITYADAELQGLGYEFLTGLKMIKVSVAEARASKRFVEVAERIGRLGVTYLVDPVLIRIVFEFVGILTLLFALVYGIGFFNLGAGDAALILGLFYRLYPKISSLLQSVQLMKSLFPAYARIVALGEAAEKAQERLEGRQLEWKEEGGGIEAKRISVSYGGQHVLQDVSVSIPQGAFVGIAGASGAGKSTLADALIGLVELEKGDILINGSSLATLSIQSWRKRVGYVGQDSVLFNASVKDNLMWGSLECDFDEVVEAAKRAQAHDFISRMPEGYDSIVGDNGVKLSGGQRQKLGLARALLGSKNVLILDESTSALDSESEKEVVRSINALQGEMTIIMIAHRLSTIRQTDWVYYLEAGTVLEEGRFGDLLKQGGRFSKMWDMQS